MYYFFDVYIKVTSYGYFKLNLVTKNNICVLFVRSINGYRIKNLPRKKKLQKFKKKCLKRNLEFVVSRG
jgi:hypothetical protein